MINECSSLILIFGRVLGNSLQLSIHKTYLTVIQNPNSQFPIAIAYMYVMAKITALTSYCHHSSKIDKYTLSSPGYCRGRLQEMNDVSGMEYSCLLLFLSFYSKNIDGCNEDEYFGYHDVLDVNARVT